MKKAIMNKKVDHNGKTYDKGAVIESTDGNFDYLVEKGHAGIPATEMGKDNVDALKVGEPAAVGGQDAGAAAASEPAQPAQPRGRSR